VTISLFTSQPPTTHLLTGNNGLAARCSLHIFLEVERTLKMLLLTWLKASASTADRNLAMKRISSLGKESSILDKN
jgi:hypothetical protein